VQTHLFESKLLLPCPRDEVFSFFADATNLEAITPPWLRFGILSPLPITMQAGVLIDYRLRLHGWPIRWRTRISVWEPPFCFVDEQLRGPYRLWVHRHTFEETNDGTLCSDVVRYAVPGGGLINALFVRREVEKIFAYRTRALLERFQHSSAQNLSST
jgi:ligand-binding SRPBCC domain-containing protein